MLRITVEIISGRKRTLATADISNMSGLADVSDYEIEVKTAARAEPSWQREWEAHGMISQHDREQSVWALVAKAAAWAARASYRRTCAIADGRGSLYRNDPTRETHSTRAGLY
jgi:hypothetical protein